MRTREELQEKIRKFVQKQLKEQDAGFSTGNGYQHNGIKKPIKKESKQPSYQGQNKKGSVPSAYTPGAKDITAYTGIGYTRAKPSDRIDAKDLWEATNKPDKITVDIPLFIRLLEYAREDAKTDMDLHDVAEKSIKLSETGKTLTMQDYNKIVSKSLNETRYSQFKKQTEVIKPSTQMHEAMKQIKRKLQEVNKIANYTGKLKTELSETNNVQYNKRTEAIVSQLMNELKSLYKSIKEIKDGSQS
jgi:hypothetical protein